MSWFLAWSCKANSLALPAAASCSQANGLTAQKPSGLPIGYAEGIEPKFQWYLGSLQNQNWLYLGVLPETETVSHIRVDTVPMADRKVL